MLLNSPAMADSAHRSAPPCNARHRAAAWPCRHGGAGDCPNLSFRLLRAAGFRRLLDCPLHGAWISVRNAGRQRQTRSAAPKDGSDGLCPMCVAIHSAPLLARRRRRCCWFLSFLVANCRPFCDQHRAGSAARLCCFHHPGTAAHSRRTDVDGRALRDEARFSPGLQMNFRIIAVALFGCRNFALTFGRAGARFCRCAIFSCHSGD